MEVTSLEKYREAKMMSEAIRALRGRSSSVSTWYEFLTDTNNPKFQYQWDQDKCKKDGDK